MPRFWLKQGLSMVVWRMARDTTILWPLWIIMEARAIKAMQLQWHQWLVQDGNTGGFSGQLSKKVSWNFKHIVHFDKIPKYNAVNVLNSYGHIGIYSLLEVIQYDNSWTWMCDLINLTFMHTPKSKITLLYILLIYIKHSRVKWTQISIDSKLMPRRLLTNWNCIINFKTVLLGKIICYIQLFLNSQMSASGKKVLYSWSKPTICCADGWQVMFYFALYGSS